MRRPAWRSVAERSIGPDTLDDAPRSPVRTPAKPPRGTTPRFAAGLVFVAYLVAARGIGNCYPVSVFDMYQGRGDETAARVMVRDVGGAVLELEEFENYSCFPRLPMITEVKRYCPAAHQPLDYVTRDQQQLLERRITATPHADGEEVAIVSRAFFLAEQPLVTQDCVIARCTAQRRNLR